MKVREVMSSAPETCRPDTDLAAVTHLMWDHDCGVIPVVDADAHVIGVVTDRDICIAAATRRLPPERLAASTVMSRRLHTCLPDDSIGEALTVMKDARVRRLPVIDEQGHVQGMLSLNDIVRAVGHPGAPPAGAVVKTLAAICTPRPSAIAVV